MNTEQILSMKGGSLEYSYANNSKLQEKTILETKPLFEEAIKEICNTMHPKIFVAADLGCSSGPNALLVLNTITNSIEKHYSRSDHNKLEIQFFLNDLPSNDFNNIFQLSALYEKQVKQEKKNEFLPFYVVGMPGSFYGRLFPTKTVHFFHSSYSLMWLSQVPKGLKGDDFCQLNKGNMYLNDESSPKLFQLYLDQYKRDFSTFLESRSKELIMGGSMILSFLGRKIVPSTGSLFHFFGLLSDALNAMASEGYVDEDKLTAFKMPVYTPLMEEVKSVVEMEGSFHLLYAQIFESNWDPSDDSTDNVVHNKNLSGDNIAKYVRAIMEPLLTTQFGNKILDDLFSRYAKNIARHMSKGKPKFTVLILHLKLKDEVK